MKKSCARCTWSDGYVESKKYYMAKSKFVPMEEVEKPNPIYKYRRWTNIYEKKVITHKQVFMAPSTSFEDKKDCKGRVRYDLLTESQLIDLYFKASLERNPQFSIEQHIKEANDWAKKSPLKNKIELIKQQEQDYIDWSKRNGILCITGDPTNVKMWDKYSDSHNGFCVGFDSNILFRLFGRGRKIEYVVKLPDIFPSNIDSYMEQSIKQVFYKEKKWGFEKEYRVTKMHESHLTQEQRIITLPFEAFKEIIFGANMSQTHKDEIIAITETTLPNIVFKQATFEGDKVTIQESIK